MVTKHTGAGAGVTVGTRGLVLVRRLFPVLGSCGRGFFFHLRLCLYTSSLLLASSNPTVCPVPVVGAQSVTLVGLSSLLLISSPSRFPLFVCFFFLLKSGFWLCARLLICEKTSGAETRMSEEQRHMKHRRLRLLMAPFSRKFEKSERLQPPRISGRIVLTLQGSRIAGNSGPNPADPSRKVPTMFQAAHFTCTAFTGS